MRVKFVGDPNNPGEQKNLPETHEAFGVVFERGKFTDVPDEYAAKFEGNNHYEVEGEKRGPGRPPKDSE